MVPSHEDHATLARRGRRCQQCGAPAANFCPSCGARHFQDSEEGRSHESLVAAGIQCVCGVDFAAEDRFCRSCGQERLVGDLPALRRPAQRAVGILDLPASRRLVQPLQLRSSPRCPTGVLRYSPGRSSPTHSPRMGDSMSSDSEEDSAGGVDSMVMLSSRFSVESRGHQAEAQTQALMHDNEELHDRTEVLMRANEELHEMVRDFQGQLQSCAVVEQRMREELREELLRQVQGFWEDDAGDFYGGACVEFSGDGWRVHEPSTPRRSKAARSETIWSSSAVYSWKVEVESRRIILHDQKQDGECRELVLTVGGQSILTVCCSADNSVWTLTRSCGSPASLFSPSTASARGRLKSVRSPVASDAEEGPGHNPLEVDEVGRLRDELAESHWNLTEAESCLAQYEEALTENSELRAALQHEKERSESRLSRISKLEQDVEGLSSLGLRGSDTKRPSLAAELASFHSGPGDEDLGDDVRVELQRLREFARRHEQAAGTDCVLGISTAEPRPLAEEEEEEAAISQPEPDMAEVLSLMGQLGQLAGAFQSFGATPPAARQGRGSASSGGPCAAVIADAVPAAARLPGRGAGS